MSIILAGDRSGTGKTTLTIALLAALKARGRYVQSFKVGPDYIDPMFHAKVTGRPCYSLDPILTSESYVQQSFFCHRSADHTVIEGVMGLFDGATGIDDTASTAHVARLLKLPVVLVVDCARMSRSLAALVQGYRDFDQRVQISGVVLNRVGSDRHLQLLTEALSAIHMPILGVFRREKTIQLPDRHLGLVPVGEMKEFENVIDRLATLGERCFEWSALNLLEKAQSQHQRQQIKSQPSSELIVKEKRVRIAIAYDAAFNFYYPDNFEILKEQGAELVFWSPMSDEILPEADGLYFGGGFPEVFAQTLSENMAAMSAVRNAIARGTPTYAECGGLMYLSQALTDFDGRTWPMVGSIAQTVKMGTKLSLGYRRAKALQDGPIAKKGQILTGHEFHRSSIVETGIVETGIVENLHSPAYAAQRYWGAKNATTHEGYQKKNLHASYVHMHFGEGAIAQRFIQTCAAFKRSR